MTQAKTLPPGQVTAFQSRVYALLLQIPEGKVATYASIAKALQSSPRAVGGALRNNPFAPEFVDLECQWSESPIADLARVPCHRVIASSGFIGGFKGDWEKVPSGVNQSMKKELLAAEGVAVDDNGFLNDPSCYWNGFAV